MYQLLIFHAYSFLLPAVWCRDAQILELTQLYKLGQEAVTAMKDKILAMEGVIKAVEKARETETGIYTKDRKGLEDKIASMKGDLTHKNNTIKSLNTSLNALRISEQQLKEQLKNATRQVSDLIIEQTQSKIREEQANKVVIKKRPFLWILMPWTW